MTPTEQDKELRDKVATIVEYWDFSPLQDEDSRIERLKNEIMQLITADRKRVALEARIDERKQLVRWVERTAPILNVENIKSIRNGQYIRVDNLLVKLKAQQEELGDN